MADYRSSAPMRFPPPSKEFQGAGEPLYPEKWPEFAEKPSGDTNEKTVESL